MISKDLLSYRDSADGLKPSTISDRGVWLERCDELWQMLEASVGKTQAECEDVFREWVNKGEGGIFCRKGLLQTLQKKLVWEEIDSTTWEQRRQEQLSDSVEKWRSVNSREELTHQLTLMRENHGQLYGDLPYCRKLLELPNWSAEQWIRRYNLGLMQGFILQSSRMDWTLEEISLDKLRYVIRYLKFFGLFYRLIEQEDSKLLLRIEGPLDLFSGSKRYRMKMAAAAGILPQCGKFQLKALCELDGKNRTLIWSDRDRIKSHYRPFFDYRSDEREQFEMKFLPWLESSSCQLVEPDLNMSMLIKDEVPDYCLENQAGDRVEIFIYEQHQFHLLKHKAPDKHKKIIVMIEKGIEKHLTAKDTFEVIQFNKIPSFTALKKKLKEIKFTK